jgi:hypothetical protein
VLSGSSPITVPRLLQKRTRSQGSFAPLALPGLNTPMTLSDFRSTRQANLTLKAPPSIERISPDFQHASRAGHDVPCPLPRRIVTGASVDCFPIPRGLPLYAVGSASTTSLSRPAQALLALRPAGSLGCPRQPLSQGSGPPVTRTNRLPATRSIDNSLGGTFLH